MVSSAPFLSRIKQKPPIQNIKSKLPLVDTKIRHKNILDNINSQNKQNMNSKVVLTSTHLPYNSVSDNNNKSNKHTHFYPPFACPRFKILCSPSSSSGSELTLTTGTNGSDGSVTGGSYDFRKATTSVTQKLLSSPKQVTLVRHGLSSWNDESRVQGSTDLSVLTEIGIMQAERCKKALVDIQFDQCFSSPISRAKSTAEILWAGRKEPLIFLDNLKEAHLFYLEGMKNVDARLRYPKEYTSWREDPSNFNVNGIYPVRQLWDTASIAWKEILFTPGDNFLVVTHKSILRALICTALGLSPERFRAFDVNNGGITVFKFNVEGEAMLQYMNMTAHMYTEHTYRY